MFLLIVFYFKSFPHEVQVENFLQNLYHKIILPTVAMYWLKNVIEHGCWKVQVGADLVINVKADW